MARCSASPLVFPQLLSSEPEPPRLMFATLIPSDGPLAVTQSMPHTTVDVVPEPDELRTRTAQSRAPGTIPTTPFASSLAAIVPETWVPWPFPSLYVPE